MTKKRNAMFRKRSIGVTIFGFLIVIGGIIGFFWNFIFYLYLYRFGDIRIVLLRTFVIFCNTMIILSIIYGIGILRLKEWARKMAIIVSAAILIIYPLLIFIFNVSFVRLNILAIVITLGFPLGIIYFFTRPNIKKQFLNQINPQTLS